MKHSKFMTLQAQTIPRGCYREIRKYQACAAAKGKTACTNEKISIMEVCPDHVLEGLREKRQGRLLGGRTLRRRCVPEGIDPHEAVGAVRHVARRAVDVGFREWARSVLGESRFEERPRTGDFVAGAAE